MSIRMLIKSNFINDSLSRFFTWMIFFIFYPLCIYAQHENSSSFKGESEIRKIYELNDKAATLNRDSTNEALTFAHEAYLLSIKNNNQFWQGVSLLRLSEGYLYNDSYDQALQYAYNALDIFAGLKNDSAIAEANTMLGWIFYDSENPNLSLDYHKKASVIFRRLMLEDKESVSFNALGLVFQQMNNNDSAYYYFEKSLGLAQKNNMSQMVSAVFNNMGICENNRGNFEQAISLFKQALPQASATGDELRIAEVLNQEAFSYLQMKDYKKADSLLRQSRELINKSTSNTRKEKLMDNLHTSALLYEATGDYKKAYQDLREYNSVGEEIISRNKSEVIAAQHLKRETQERENKINELNAQKELRNFQLYALIAVVILLIIIAAFAYSRMRHKREKEKQQEMMNQLMLKKELESSIIEKENLNTKLDYKNTSLKDFALFVAHNNELVNELIKEFEVLFSKIESKNYLLPENKKIIRDFLHKYEQNLERSGFNLKADEIQSDFLYNLLQKYPDLSENEQKLCSQIRHNLSSKEIASENNISVKSVEMARYRLRKRFGLNQKEDLNEFLRAF